MSTSGSPASWRWGLAEQPTRQSGQSGCRAGAEARAGETGPGASPALFAPKGGGTACPSPADAGRPWQRRGRISSAGQRRRRFMSWSATLRCRDCSRLPGSLYKRSQLVAMRPTKIPASDPPSTWGPGER